MSTLLSIHRIKAMRIDQKTLEMPGPAVYRTKLVATHEDGSETEVCMFHSTEPVQIEGAEFVNFCAQGEPA